MCQLRLYAAHALDDFEAADDGILQEWGTQVAVSGPPAALIEHCLQRLSSWTTLALGTLRGEFPNFEVLQTFNMFCLVKKPLRNMAPEELQALQSQ